MIIKTWYPEKNTGSDFTHPKYVRILLRESIIIDITIVLFYTGTDVRG